MLDSLFIASYLGVWILAVIQGFILVVLLKQMTELRIRAEQGITSVDNRLPTGARAPKFSAEDISTGTFLKDPVGRTEPVLLLFVSSECGLCRRIVRELRRASADTTRNVLPFCYGTDRGCANLLRQLEGSSLPLLTNAKENVPALYRVSGFPTLIAIDESGLIAGYKYPQSADDVLSALTADAESANAGAELLSTFEEAVR